MTSAGHHVMLGGASAPPAPAYWGLCFTAEEPNVTVNMAKTNTPPAVTLETSTDGVTWTAFDADGGTTPVTLSAIGDHVFFRAGTAGNAQFGLNRQNYHKFTLSGKCGASGDCTSILSASAPTLSFNSANEAAFISLFNGCASLTSAPILPTATLAMNCYREMFVGCTALTVVPEIGATALASSCFRQMFSGCTSLAVAPRLIATTLAATCYQLMFDGCSSLKWLELFATSWTGATSAFSNWVRGVAASGTFRCPTALGTDATITRGASNCPVGWTVVNTD